MTSEKNVDTDSADITTESKVIEKLSDAVLDTVRPELSTARNMLSELTENQRVVLERVTEENRKFAENDCLMETEAMMKKAKFYHQKLLHIKQEMVAMHDSSAKLKKRALKLQQQKQKDALLQEQARERELERERQLVAKPAQTTKNADQS